MAGGMSPAVVVVRRSDDDRAWAGDLQDMVSFDAPARQARQAGSSQPRPGNGRGGTDTHNGGSRSRDGHATTSDGYD
jgi:hypothetical protein